MQSNLIKDALWGKEKAAAAGGQHIKAEHQLQLSNQLYYKENNCVILWQAGKKAFYPNSCGSHVMLRMRAQNVPL